MLRAKNQYCNKNTLKRLTGYVYKYLRQYCFCSKMTQWSPLTNQLIKIEIKNLKYQHQEIT